MLTPVDMALKCADSSRVRICGLPAFYILTHEPRKLLGTDQPDASHFVVDANSIRWNYTSVGSRFTGLIDLKSNRWERRIDGELYAGGLCKRTR
jgi:hypothetical protein